MMDHTFFINGAIVISIQAENEAYRQQWIVGCRQLDVVICRQQITKTRSPFSISSPNSSCRRLLFAKTTILMVDQTAEVQRQILVTTPTINPRPNDLDTQTCSPIRLSTANFIHYFTRGMPNIHLRLPSNLIRGKLILGARVRRSLQKSLFDLMASCRLCSSFWHQFDYVQRRGFQPLVRCTPTVSY